ADLGRGIAVSMGGDAFIAGSTFSNDFPVVSPFKAQNGGNGDAFIARLNPAGTALVYASYLGGSGADEAAGVALDSNGNAYLVGDTASTDFNLVNPLQRDNRGLQDVFITKVNPNGSALVYSTY